MLKGGTLDQETHIEQEVQRRSAKVVKELNEQIAELQSVVEQQHRLLTSEPCSFGTLLAVQPPDESDGTRAVVLSDGKAWEVNSTAHTDLKPGDAVKLHGTKKYIIGPGKEWITGPVCRVIGSVGHGIEIDEKGEKRILANPKGLEVIEGDRVITDPSVSIVLDRLPSMVQARYRVSQDMNVTWEDIGGLESAKEQIREVIELPFQNQDLFRHYKVRREPGVALFGPPGTGKTMLARAAACALAKLHGKAALETGYIYVKSPEILDKWVGNSEAEIRRHFDMARQHFHKHGFPAILAYDEFDAIAPQRGTRRSSDVADTLVPMFLGEMDGIDEEETKCNPIIFIMSNRMDIIDPAIIRPGRISRHIRIDRPDLQTAFDIFSIHAANVPFHREDMRQQVLTITCQDIFAKSRLLYRINNEYEFTFANCINGAMLASIVDHAKMQALRRDMKATTQTGVTLDDFRAAVQQMYSDQRGLNHSYDLQDFLESKGLQPGSAQIERCFGAA